MIKSILSFLGLRKAGLFTEVDMPEEAPRETGPKEFDEFVDPGKVKLGVIGVYTVLGEDAPCTFTGTPLVNVQSSTTSERFTLFRLERNSAPGYVWAYFCKYMFSPTLDKHRYKHKLYTPEAVKAAIPKWISAYQDKKAIRQFREAGLYEPPRIS